MSACGETSVASPRFSVASARRKGKSTSSSSPTPKANSRTSFSFARSTLRRKASVLVSPTVGMPSVRSTTKRARSGSKRLSSAARTAASMFVPPEA